MVEMASKRARVLLLTSMIVVAAQVRPAVSKRERVALEETRQDGAPRASLLDDLIRTAAHQKPKTGAPAPPTNRPQLPAQLRTNLPSSLTAGATSKRVTNLAEPPPEDKNRTLPSMAPPPQSRALNNQRAQVAAGAPSLASVRARWRLMEQTIGRSLASVGVELNKTLEEIYASMSRLERPVSKSCKHSLGRLLDGLRDRELWASQLVDASAGVGGLPAGLLEGTLTDLGHFDECLAVSHRFGADPTTGQYCSLLVKPALVGRPRLHTVCRRMPNLSPILNSNGGANPSAAAANSTVRLLAQQSHQFYYAGMRLGICVPSGCQRADVEQILQTYLDRFELIGQVKHCQRATDEQDGAALAPTPSSPAKPVDGRSGPLGRANLANFDLLQQYILLAYAILSILILLGTALDTGGRRSRIRGSTARTAGDGHVISGLAGQRAGCAHNAWQLHYQDQADKRTAATCKEPGDARPLGPQRNPLVNFASDSAAPLSQQALDSAGQPRDYPAAVTRRAHFDTAVRDKPNRPDVVGADLLPIYDEIRAPGGQPPTKLREFLVCFSLRSTFRSIARITAPSSEPGLDGRGRMSDIKVIHGLRTLSMTWIIFGHTIGLVSPEMMNNLFALADLSCSSRLLQAVLNTTLAVDTFFMISGLVTVVSFVRRCKSAATVLLRPSKSDAPPELRFERALGRSRPPRGCHPNDYQEGACRKLSAETHSSLSTEEAPRFDAHQTGAAMEQLHLDGMEVVSLDSSSSAASSRSTSISAASSNGLHSKSSSQQNFILNGATHSTSDERLGQPELASGWPADFKPLSWLLMRYLRLTPAYAAVIGLSILMPALGSGPFWPETVGRLGPACRANWWTNLLYVNNFIETDNLCLIHSWYLSNDWQFFLAALFLFGIAYKSRKLALLVLLGLLVGSSTATFMISVEHDYPPTIVTTSPAIAERWEFIHALYYKPWPHLPSYLVGLIAGCMILRLHQLESAERPAASWLRLSTRARIICWLLSASIALAVLNSIYPWNMGLQVDPVLAGLHSATFRTLWAACCAWLVFALVSRPKSPLALMLGWQGFQVTSRLTYCAYLVHPLVIYYHFGVLRERIDSSVYGQLHRFMATLLTSYLFAFLVSACFEGPFIKLQSFIAQLAATGAKQTRDDNSSTHNRAFREKRRLATDSSHSFADTPGMPSSASSVRGASSLDMPSTSPRLTPTWNHTANHLSPSNSRGDTCFHLDDHTSPCGHGQRSKAARQHSCHYQDVLSAVQNQKHNANHGGVDVEFQRKLAQAIGRGFKIRSKIVNGSTSGVETRRGGQAKCVPGLSAGETSSASVLAFEALGRKRIRSNQSKTQRRPVVARRTDAFSTFVSTPTSDGRAATQEDNR